MRFFSYYLRWWIRQRLPNGDLKAAIPNTDSHRRATAIIHRNRGIPTLRATTAANRPIIRITVRRHALANRPAPIWTTSMDRISRDRLVAVTRRLSNNSNNNNIISRLIPNTVAEVVTVVTVHHHLASLSCHRKSIEVANHQTDSWHAPPRSDFLDRERATSMVWISIRIPRRLQDRLQASRARALPTVDLINLTTT